MITVLSIQHQTISFGIPCMGKKIHPYTWVIILLLLNPNLFAHIELSSKESVYIVWVDRDQEGEALHLNLQKALRLAGNSAGPVWAGLSFRSAVKNVLATGNGPS